VTAITVHRDKPPFTTGEQLSVVTDKICIVTFRPAWPCNISCISLWLQSSNAGLPVKPDTSHETSDRAMLRHCSSNCMELASPETQNSDYHWAVLSYFKDSHLFNFDRSRRSPPAPSTRQSNWWTMVPLSKSNDRLTGLKICKKQRTSFLKVGALDWTRGQGFPDRQCWWQYQLHRQHHSDVCLSSSSRTASGMAQLQHSSMSSLHPLGGPHRDWVPPVIPNMAVFTRRCHSFCRYAQTTNFLSLAVL